MAFGWNLAPVSVIHQTQRTKNGTTILLKSNNSKTAKICTLIFRWNEENCRNVFHVSLVLSFGLQVATRNTPSQAKRIQAKYPFSRRTTEKRFPFSLLAAIIHFLSTLIWIDGKTNHFIRCWWRRGWENCMALRRTVPDYWYAARCTAWIRTKSN